MLVSGSRQGTQGILKWGGEKGLNRKCVQGVGRSKGRHQCAQQHVGWAAKGGEGAVDRTWRESCSCRTGRLVGEAAIAAPQSAEREIPWLSLLPAFYLLQCFPLAERSWKEARGKGSPCRWWEHGERGRASGRQMKSLQLKCRVAESYRILCFHLVIRPPYVVSYDSSNLKNLIALGFLGIQLYHC